MSDTPQTDLALAGELVATAAYIAAMSPDAGVHLDRLRRAVDFLEGKRPGTPYRAVDLVRRDPVCHAIYMLGVRDGVAAQGVALPGGGEPTP